MTAAERHLFADIARHRRTLANPETSAFEKEVARAALDKLTAPPICRYCLDLEESHNGAVCKVLARFRKKHGKGTFPNADQAKMTRAAVARTEADKVVERERADAKSRQQKLW